MGCCHGEHDELHHEPPKTVVRLATKRMMHRANSIEEVTFTSQQFIQKKNVSIYEHYRLGKTIGAGAFGQVFVAHHRRSNLPRAIKCLDKVEYDTDQEIRKNFKKEMTILRSMDHPNIIKLFEIIEDDTKYYFVTELCRGGELFDYIIHKGTFEESVAAQFTKQILHALSYIHSKGIVHRDLKPDNLLLDMATDQANIKVIDFGTSALVDNTRKIDQCYGTPYYTAPEILQNRFSEKCDVWSCGVILYLMLSGQPPFTGNTDVDIYKEIQRAKYSMSGGAWDNVSDSAKDLISKMLVKSPKDRISAQDAIAHPWIQLHSQSTFELAQAHIAQSLKNLEDFREQHKLKQAVLTFIASQVITHECTGQLQQAFRELDTDCDGTLSTVELESMSQRLFGDQTSGVCYETLLRSVDIDGSGFIDFSEFVVATMSRAALLSEKNLEHAFDAFDIDGNGGISLEEIKEILGDIDMEESVWSDFLDNIELDTNGDINLESFIEFMTSDS